MASLSEYVAAREFEILCLRTDCGQTKCKKRARE